MDKNKITPFHDNRVDALIDEALDEMARKDAAANSFLEKQALRESQRQREHHAKAWLNKVYEVTKKELAAKEEVKDRLFGMITNGAVDYSKDRVQSSETSGQEKRTVAYAEAAEAVERTKEKIAGLVTERMMVIGMVTGSNYRTILIHRYINTKKWEEIAADMNYSVQHCKRLFDSAITAVTPIIEEYLKQKGEST